MLLHEPRFGFTFSFQDRLMLHLAALLDVFFNWKCQCSCRIIGNVANDLKHCYFLDGDGIDYVTLPL